MAKTAIEQKYTNPFETNIKAVYTFPLVSSAVLLNVEIKINDRILRGQIVESSDADQQYEEAMIDGNRAIMVEKDSAGVYTVKVGNILPNDNITVVFEYTELLSWKQDRVKLSIPTVIAQKYGDSSKLNMNGIKEPVYSWNAENYFTFEMFVSGVLAGATVHSPSHSIDVKENASITHINLFNSSELIERDIVLTFDTVKNKENRSFALFGGSIDGYAAIASFYPSLEIETAKKPKSVTFVIDCSGSMEGISIEKAKSALYKAIEQLDETDYVNMVLFGSESKKIFEREVPASVENLKSLKRTIDYIDADMGGTEMEEALNDAYSGKIEGLTIDRYVFLITDGQVYDHNGVTKNAILSEMTHFIVGVGYATDEALLQQISARTKGSFENIDPNENMDHYILNLFKKINAPKTTDIKIAWPVQSTREIIPKVVYDGDTLYAYAFFKEKPTGEVTLAYTLEDGETHTLATQIIDADTDKSPSAVSRIVANAIINRVSNETLIIKYSLDYQLFSEHTKYILTDEVPDDMKPYSRPKLHQVRTRIRSAGIGPARVAAGNYEYLSVPAFMRQSSDLTSEEISDEQLLSVIDQLPGYYVEMAITLLNAWFVNSGKVRLPDSVREIKDIGINRKELLDVLNDDNVIDFMQFLAERYMSEFDLSALDHDFISEVL
jgi:Ca-activated chloride channel family protein